MGGDRVESGIISDPGWMAPNGLYYPCQPDRAREGWWYLRHGEIADWLVVKFHSDYLPLPDDDPLPTIDLDSQTYDKYSFARTQFILLNEGYIRVDNPHVTAIKPLTAEQKSSMRLLLQAMFDEPCEDQELVDAVAAFVMEKCT